jgi:hypothetical protein
MAALRKASTLLRAQRKPKVVAEKKGAKKAE